MSLLPELGSWSWYVLRCRRLALECGCHGCWGEADTGSRLGAGLLTNLQAHPGNDRRAHFQANQRVFPLPFVMSLMALMARPLRGHRVLCRVKGHTILCRGGCPKCGGLAGRYPEWDFHAHHIRQGACHNVKIYQWSVANPTQLVKSPSTA